MTGRAPSDTDADRSTPNTGWAERGARLVLMAETAMLALWPAAAVLGGFLALAFVDLLPRLGGVLHLIVLLAFAAGFVWTLRYAARRLHLPTDRAVWRRLEQDSGLDHRPLSTLYDQPAAADPAALSLWRLHRDRLVTRLGRLRLTPPRPVLAKGDPFAMRMLALLLVAATGLYAWGEWDTRLGKALRPALFGAPTAQAGPGLDLWLSPPEYTGLAPVFLATADGRITDQTAATVPVGSRVIARLPAGAITPQLIHGRQKTAFTPLPQNAGWQVEKMLVVADQLSIRRGPFSRFGPWSVTLIPDRPPEIAFDGEPSGTDRGSLEVALTASDDFGLTALRATASLAASVEAAAERPPIRIDLPLADTNHTAVTTRSFEDLSAHPWAGLPVRLVLEAEDGLGQTGQSAALEIILPERRFTHPVAIQVIELRRQLALKPSELRLSVSGALRRLANDQEAFGHDSATFLLLRVAATRLRNDHTLSDLATVESLLWHTALHIEDGGVSIAERALRQAQRDLMEALSDDSRNAEDLNVLMDEVQRQTEALVQALMERAQDLLADGMEMPPVSPEMARRMMESSELQDMLDQLRDLSETGSREAAQELLAELQEMLEQLDPSALQPMSEQAQQAMDAMEQLGDLVERQEQLLDETYRRSQADRAEAPEGPMWDGWQGTLFPNLPDSALPMPTPPSLPPMPGSQGSQPGAQSEQALSAPAETPELGRSQQALRRELGQIMTELGGMLPEVPENMGEAELSMRGAENSLGAGDAEGALPGQRQAIELLRDGAEQMAQQMFGAAGRLMGLGVPQGMGGYREGRDPFGNRMDGEGGLNTDTVEIPSEEQLRRAREILRELRRRAADPDRSEGERDYIDRLLDRF